MMNKQIIANSECDVSLLHGLCAILSTRNFICVKGASTTNRFPAHVMFILKVGKPSAVGAEVSAIN